MSAAGNDGALSEVTCSSDEVSEMNLLQNYKTVFMPKHV